MKFGIKNVLLLAFSCLVLSAQTSFAQISGKTLADEVLYTSEDLLDMYRFGLIDGSDGGVGAQNKGGNYDCKVSSGSTGSVSGCSGCVKCVDKKECQSCCSNNCSNTGAEKACQALCK